MTTGLGYSLPVRLSVAGAAFAGGWAVFLALGDSWWQLAVAGFLACVFGQIALVTRDLADRQADRGRPAGGIGGRLSGNLVVGMPYGWWTDERTRLHAVPGREGPVPEVSPRLALLLRFLPLLVLEGFALRVASVRALRSATMKAWGTEAGLLLAHITLYLCALFLVLSPGRALAFLLLHQGAFGVYLVCAPACSGAGSGACARSWRPVRRAAIQA
ncbi:hypothetical protein ACWD6P_31715 [Streptomyces sp. NPDC002446]